MNKLKIGLLAMLWFVSLVFTESEGFNIITLLVLTSSSILFFYALLMLRKPIKPVAKES